MAELVSKGDVAASNVTLFAFRGVKELVDDELLSVDDHGLLPGTEVEFEKSQIRVHIIASLRIFGPLPLFVNPFEVVQLLFILKSRSVIDVLRGKVCVAPNLLRQ